MLHVIQTTNYCLPLRLKLQLPFPFLANTLLIKYFVLHWMLFFDKLICLLFLIDAFSAFAACTPFDRTELMSVIRFSLEWVIKFLIEMFLSLPMCIFWSISWGFQRIIEVMEASWCWMMTMIVRCCIKIITVLMFFCLFIHLLEAGLLLWQKFNERFRCLFWCWLMDEFVDL